MDDEIKEYEQSLAEVTAALETEPSEELQLVANELKELIRDLKLRLFSAPEESETLDESTCPADLKGPKSSPKPKINSEAHIQLETGGQTSDLKTFDSIHVEKKDTSKDEVHSESINNPKITISEDAVLAAAGSQMEAVSQALGKVSPEPALSQKVDETITSTQAGSDICKESDDKVQSQVALSAGLDKVAEPLNVLSPLDSVPDSFETTKGKWRSFLKKRGRISKRR
ncbi:hypothetical protein DASB73_015800 [Starmerella bacillaris]|uniref:Uncharacterized protein n=1 Tax=Starmerella bacillaris TaxID=1247836 RepID=A0AAV5RHP8_STABA|nr:hypothetical protein DASB73_015800 [Starmerella bacillaris]